MSATTLDCGHVPTPTDGAGTGVAWKRMPDGTQDSMCYHCAYVETMDDIVMAGVAGNPLDLPVLYVSTDGRKITTWDGQEVGIVTTWGERHNFSDPLNDRRYITAVIKYGADRVTCYGTGSNGMYALLKRYKSDITEGGK